jgi:starch phosphorylase
LREIAYNLRWAWDHDAIGLFRRLDPELWESTGHNPVLMLGTIDQAQLEAAAADEGFRGHLERVSRDFAAYTASTTTWFRRVHGDEPATLVAYFSAEFGLTESLSIFAGGLGLLSGDHLKSASDLGVPLVGVGLLYQQGYFRQQLSESGWQQEAREDNDFYNMPLHLERNPEGAPLTVELAMPGRQVVAQVWRVRVGRVDLFLLDTNLAVNSPEDRRITQQLYGGDLDMRIRQEIVLGIGGYRALEALGVAPNVYHMNEGHSGFLALERVLRLMQTGGLTFAQAREIASASLIFTSHTPVPAGHDYFPPDLFNRYFADYARGLGLSPRQLMALGQTNQSDDGEHFCMTVLALRLAAHSNGVSRLHGAITRRMWQNLWPGLPVEEVPVGHVTNGVHFRSWISPEMNQVYERYLSPRWIDEPTDAKTWQAIERIPAEELWRTHERRRERLVAFARRQLMAQLERSGAPEAELEAAKEALDLEALTIGFARRFATYKRGALLLRDPDRLARILSDPKRPMQVIFAGKAHPKDEPGKALIQKIVTLSRQEPFRRRLIFLEDYDTSVARYMVQGSDVWLNTPRRPLEASGTSGMKAVANGVLNLSTLDGWWDEAWHDFNNQSAPIGWAIGRGEDHTDPEQQDQVEAEALYDLLEQDVVPAFYDRGADGLPRRWIARMKTSMQNLSPFFNTHRMLRDYTELFYLPAAQRYERLASDGNDRPKALARWRAKVERNWPQINVEVVGATPEAELEVGSEIRVVTRVRLGALTPDDVLVQLYLGRVNAQGEIVDAKPMALHPLAQEEEGTYLFEAVAVPFGTSGLCGFTVRVLPRHPDLVTPFVPGLVTWANGQ